MQGEQFGKRLLIKKYNNDNLLKNKIKYMKTLLTHKFSLSHFCRETCKTLATCMLTFTKHDYFG